MNETYPPSPHTSAAPPPSAHTGFGADGQFASAASLGLILVGAAVLRVASVRARRFRTGR